MAGDDNPIGVITKGAFQPFKIIIGRKEIVIEKCGDVIFAESGVERLVALRG